MGINFLSAEQAAGANHSAPTDLLSLTLHELETWLVERGQQPYRARQIFGWVYRELVTDPALMRTLPLALRDLLAKEAVIGRVVVVNEKQSRDHLTTKVLLSLADGQMIESVLMLYPPSDEGRARASVCLSTQAGCAYGCTFCATGRMGWKRHLSAGEIVAQVLFFARQLRQQAAKDGRPAPAAPSRRLLPGEAAPRGSAEKAAAAAGLDRITNVVLMGMGEPLHNYEESLKALHILHTPEGFQLGARHMTLSTCGLVPGILRLAGEPLQVNLAISLHAPTDEQRSAIMPVNRKWPLAELLGACQSYVERTGRQVTFEYVMLAGINDRLEQAHELGQRLRGLLCHVNLIPVNATAAGHIPPSYTDMKGFQATLRAYGVSSTIRAERGDDIDAACGQLYVSTTK